MTLRRCDAGAMSPEARVAELGALLARAYRRLVARNQQISLADVASSERACDRSAGGSRESQQSEVA